ncbi:MAG: hypothetical protein VYD87_01385 [Pseudomonadota bacterium]|nr:hypothetical protein [Pseudomonadota bacterium]
MGAPRLQSAGSVHAMISDALDAARRTAVRDALGFDAATLSHWCDPAEGNGRRMPVVHLDQVARMSPAAAQVAARHFAALAGGEFRPGSGESKSLGASLAGLARQVAEASSDWMLATDPEGPGGVTVTEAERRELLADVDAAADLIAQVRGLLTRGARS